MARELIFSIYQNHFDKKSKPVSGSWQYWVDQLKEPLITEDKNTLAMVLGHIPQDETRLNDLVEYTEAIGIDLDDITEETLLSVCTKLAPFEYVLYSSHSHNPPEVLKLRVILPLNERATPDQHPAYWNSINSLIGGHNDPQTKNIARLFYIHSCPEERKEHALFHHNEGRWFSVDDCGSLPFDVPGPRDLGGEAQLVASSEPPGVSLAAPTTPASTMLLTTDLVLEEGRRRARRAGSNDRMVGQLLKALAKGDSFASKGERENSRFLLCQTLFETWPNASMDAACELFRASLTRMHEDSPLKQGVEGTLKEVRYKLGRAQAKVAAEEQRREVRRRGNEARINYEARGDGNDTPYSDEDLKHIAELQGCHTSELVSRWITYKDGTAYFLNMKGYQGPFGKNDVRSVAATFLHPIQNITAYNPPMQRGGTRSLKGYSELCAQYGSVIHDIEASLTHTHSTYDKRTGKLIEVTAPRDESLRPVKSETVHEWLLSMGHDQAAKLIDWVACVPKLERQCCALYLWGHKGTGKTLLISGLARIWGLSDSTPLDAVIEGFNERLARMPLIVADEYLPDTKNMSGKLRELIASTSHTLNRKYRAEASLTGCIRLVVLANTPHLLDLKGDHTKEDLDAIAERFLFISTDKRAAAYLSKLSRAEKDHMLKRGIAEHCLWLSENWEIEEGNRFIVEGSLGEANLNITINNERTALICEWLVEYLATPETLSNNPHLRGLVKIEDGSLWVNSYAIQKGWGTYMDNKAHSLSARNIGIAVKAIASKEDDSEHRWRVDGRMRKFYRIDTDLLAKWSEAHGRMSHGDIAEILGGAPF